MTDITHLFPEIVREFLGNEPTETFKGGRELRFGSRQSLSIDLDKGRWFDFERQIGGNILEFIMDQAGMDATSKAMKWLEDQGMIPKTEFIPKPKQKQNGTLQSTYNYVDENGELQYQVLRYANPRTFKQRASDGTWSIKHLTPIPYRLPEMLAQQNTILIVEGEKDVDNLYELGLTATCNNGGAGNFKDELVPWFTNRTVIIIPDNDEAGQKHAQDVAKKLHPVVTSIRIINLPGLGPKGDVSDWIQMGGTRTQLIDICKAAPFWEPPPDVEINSPHVTNYFEPLPHCNDKGKPLVHIDNLREILYRLQVNIRYNVITKEDEILIPGQSFTMDNKANATLAWIESECSRFGFSTSKVSEFIVYLADQNLYNPVATWIESKPWDGVSRLEDLYNTIYCVKNSDNDLKEVLMRRWLISAIAAAFSPVGVAAPGILVLQGDQYLGKTKWFKSLVPEEMDLVKDGFILDPSNKDSVEQACSFWLVELGELDATFKKSDIAALKAFITNKSDVFRKSYARKKSQFARRTVFFGSVNNKNYLNDPTGNRRFWTIECADIKHSHGIDMQQLWAEVLHHWRNGESYFLTPEEMNKLNEHNEDFTVMHPIAEKIATKLAWDDPASLWTWRTVTSVLESVGIDKPNPSDATSAGIYIRRMNGGKGKRSNGVGYVLVPNNK